MIMNFKKISDENPLILASASPRRKELLTQVNIPFIVKPGDIDENGETGPPCDICMSLAEKKALSLHEASNPGWILGADTIVVKDGIIMGKPADAEEAASMLGRLSSGDHEVITGFSIINPEGLAAFTGYESTVVSFKKLSEKEITAYIKTGEPFGKAGAYAIQGIGAFMIKSISGSYSNVVGLPLFAVIQALTELGAIDLFPFEIKD